MSKYYYNVGNLFSWIREELHDHDCPDFKTVNRLIRLVDQEVRILKREIRNRKYYVSSLTKRPAI